ncbi:hypothetical protein [Mesomycoplasma molare]|uniref:DUF2283 domain-containing protein n=1 Tax=Mesomycoplasma molare TaxID=171288 RepID=A0ABY5TTP6_9BACT|nr:hypothetical protein [Mesomycoplasma molare]UWD34037.1 hypothetical protein NX772_02940 [Mesomycoplasma molare]
MKLRTKYQVVFDDETNDVYLIDFKAHRTYSELNGVAEIYKIDKNAIITEIKTLDKQFLAASNIAAKSGLRLSILEELVKEREGE